MADPNLGQLTASVFEKVMGTKPEDNVFTSMFLLHHLKGGKSFKSVDGGRVIEEPLEYAENSTVKSYSDLETLDTTRVDVFDAARFEWKEIGGTCVYSNLEKLRAQGDAAKFELVARKVNNAKQTMLAVINRQLYGAGTGNGGKDIGGLGLLLPQDPTTGSVGGINRANFPFWRSRAQDGSMSASAFDSLRGAMRTIYNNCSRGAYAEHPTAFVFDQDSFEGYESTLTTNERFTTKDVGDGGFKNEVLKFKGAKVAFDEDCTDATGFVLNQRNLRLVYPTGGWMKKFAPVEPANQTAEVVRFATVCNLTINNPRRLGRIFTIS